MWKYRTRYIFIRLFICIWNSESWNFLYYTCIYSKYMWCLYLQWSDPCSFILLAGQPLNEPVAQQGKRVILQNSLLFSDIKVWKHNILLYKCYFRKKFNLNIHLNFKHIPALFILIIAIFSVSQAYNILWLTQSNFVISN